MLLACTYYWSCETRISFTILYDHVQFRLRKMNRRKEVSLKLVFKYTLLLLTNFTLPTTYLKKSKILYLWLFHIHLVYQSGLDPLGGYWMDPLTLMDRNCFPVVGTLKADCGPLQFSKKTSRVVINWLFIYSC